MMWVLGTALYLLIGYAILQLLKRSPDCPGVNEDDRLGRRLRLILVLIWPALALIFITATTVGGLGGLLDALRDDDDEDPE